MNNYGDVPQGCIVRVVVVGYHAVHHAQAGVNIVYVLNSTGVPYISLDILDYSESFLW